MDPEENPHPHLEAFKIKLMALCDDVHSVVMGIIAGLLVWGSPGNSKSWTIKDKLRKLKVAWREPSGTMTPRALYLQLQQYPDDVHLIEDQETLLADPKALSILRAALWTTERDSSNNGRLPARAVHWETARGPEVTIFGGGIILVQNAAPPQTPQSLAIQSRMLTRHLTASTDEMAAWMRHLAVTCPPTILNYPMTTAECSEVAEYLISESLKLQQPLNLRLLDIAYGFYVQFQIGESAQHWHDRVAAQLTKRFSKSPLHPVDDSGCTALDRLERDRAIVIKILDETSDPQEQVRLWCDRTGKGQSTFYKRKKEVEDLK